jgi:hypothetical protein
MKAFRDSARRVLNSGRLLLEVRLDRVRQSFVRHRGRRRAMAWWSAFGSTLRPRPSLQPATGVPGSRADLRAVLSAGKARPTDMRGLRPAALVAGALALVTVTAYRPTIELAASFDSPYDIPGGLTIALLTFGSADVWVPVIAGVALLGIVATAIVTGGFTRGRRSAMVGAAVSMPTAGVVSIPLLVSALIALVTLVLTILFFITLAALVLQIVFRAFD